MAEIKEQDLTTPAAPAAPPPRRPARAGKKKMVKRLIALGVTAAIVAGVCFGVWYLVFRDTSTVGEPLTSIAEIGTIQSTVEGYGTAVPKESASITLNAAGTVQEVYVTVGQQVFAGDPLYTIDSQEARDKLQQAQDNLNGLMEDMADLQEELANLTVRAPFSGKLQEVEEFQPDQEVSKNQKVAVLVNDRKLKLSLYFSYAYDGQITPGQSVQVTIPAVMREFTGTVEKVNRVSYISPEGAVHFEAVIVFDNPGTLTAGMDASAVLTAPDGSTIYPYENGKTEFYESRTIVTKAGGPVASTGNLLNYANVEAGEVLLTLGSSTVDSEIRAKAQELEDAQKRLAEAQTALANFSAVSPIDGTVTSCNLTPGQEVKSGATVVMISNNVTMLVTITVDDKNISFIKPGDTVDLDWNGTTYQGVVTSIDMAGAESGQGMTNYPVTLTVDNYDGSLIEGAYLQYSFVTSESSDCVLIPTTAVQYFSDTEGNRTAVVFVQRDTPPEDIPELQYPELQEGTERTYPSQEEGYYPVVVETGLSDPQNVEIRSGVQEGDMVFVNYTVTDNSYG